MLKKYSNITLNKSYNFCCVKCNFHNMQILVLFEIHVLINNSV